MLLYKNGNRYSVLLDLKLRQPVFGIVCRISLWNFTMMIFCMFTVGKCVGLSIKIDTNTLWASRGKYARICAEVDFTKPLLSKLSHDGGYYV